MLLNRWRDSCMRFCRCWKGTVFVINWCLSSDASLTVEVPTHHFVVLYEHHVVRTESSAKDDTSHTLETMDPLLSLWPLASHIKHPVHHRRPKKVSQTMCPKYQSAVRFQYLLVSHFYSRPPHYSPEVQLFAGELFFNDTSCFDSRSQYILLSGKVVWLANSVHFIQVADNDRTNTTQLCLGCDIHS